MNTVIDWTPQPRPACVRHWFTYYGSPGTSSPVCRRCGAENPRYDPERDLAEHDVTIPRRPRPLLTTAQVARVRGVSRWKVVREVHTGQLQIDTASTPRRFLFDPDTMIGGGRAGPLPASSG